MALALFVLLFEVLQDVPGIGLVGEEAELAVGGCLLEEAPGGLVQVDLGDAQLGGRVTREISEVTRMAAMKNEAILTPSGRSMMLAMVV